MLTVREYARLTIDPATKSLDLATISPSAFGWLAQHGRGSDKALPLVRMEGPRTLSLRNYVGVIETPCGTIIEILPKHFDDEVEPQKARRLLITMISEALNLKPKVGSSSMIEAFRLPMTEWLATAFLNEALEIVRRGPRQDYRTVNNRQPYLRGRLDIAQQTKAAATGAHLFSIWHDEFSFDRPENRLIRSAVELVSRRTTSPDSWRIARELSILLADVPISRDIKGDIRKWAGHRHLADYARIKPLCELLLNQRLPFAVSGEYQGISLLFPMERLFERYVLNSLRIALPLEFDILSQHAGLALCTLNDDDWFQMRPDIIVTSRAQKWIVDAKWKRLSSDRGRNNELSQADFYQMFAYGQKYLGGTGDMFLVYPNVNDFPNLPAPFKLSDDLRVHVIPFDLEARSAPYTFLHMNAEDARHNDPFWARSIRR